jgi:hypothetical protein
VHTFSVRLSRISSTANDFPAIFLPTEHVLRQVRRVMSNGRGDKHKRHHGSLTVGEIIKVFE